MKYIKFYVDTEDIRKKIKEEIKDIRIISSNIDTDNKTIEITCLVEAENGDVDQNNINCYRTKL